MSSEKVDEAFVINCMNEFIETIKNSSKCNKKLAIIVDNYSNESYNVQSQIVQKEIIKTRLDDGAAEVMCETIEDLDKERELRHNKIKF